MEQQSSRESKAFPAGFPGELEHEEAFYLWRTPGLSGCHTFLTLFRLLPFSFNPIYVSVFWACERALTTAFLVSGERRRRSYIEILAGIVAN
ncbi:conserved hypothetical protein [Ricinus communis]|uniref:Uncharacterized protein n=1 Tax=Ricinus communis TaxID=3988 RepID=B9T9A5_RICCO|nr:conserved hypothetical protein [Ricinus communis]